MKFLVGTLMVVGVAVISASAIKSQFEDMSLKPKVQQRSSSMKSENRNGNEKPAEYAASELKRYMSGSNQTDFAVSANQMKEFESKIDVRQREADDLNSWISQNRVKEQLNSETLSPSLRRDYFDKIRTLTKMRIEIIELRMNKLELIEAAIKSRSKAKESVKS